MTASVGATEVPLLQADGRVLAADLVAAVDLPPFATSAVDGYAVRLADVAQETLPISGCLADGAAAVPLQPATSQRIFTGAVLPPGADTVFMQEDVEALEGTVRLPSGLKTRREYVRVRW